jgi:sec-independent protein translocase protein TatA
MNIGGLGTWELLIILVIVIVIFGVGKLSDVGGALGKSIREFKDASAGHDDDVASDESVSDSKA